MKAKDFQIGAARTDNAAVVFYVLCGGAGVVRNHDCGGILGG
jgi:hypothetical protein